MIFRIKHVWRRSLVVTVGLAALSLWAGAWEDPAGGHFSIGVQVALGLAGAAAALMVDGALHMLFWTLGGDRYRRAADAYGREILGSMQGREYLAGGLMAAVAEEPLFRGWILRSFDSALVGIGVSSLLFALAHWLRRERWPFFLWAIWEGAMFGGLFVATGSLVVTMVAHGLHDVVAYAALGRMVRDP